MEGSSPEEPDTREPGDANDADDDALRRLSERLDRASDAAERLIAEVAAGASTPRTDPRDPRDPRDPPPAGWQSPEPDPRTGRRTAELELLAALVQSLRDLIPPELRHRLAEALRELLLAIRALIDWYLNRIEQRARPVEVQDIPIS